MEGIANFSADLFGGAQLVGLAFVLGGLAWGLAILSPLRPDPLTAGTPVRRCISLMTLGGALLAAAQLLDLALKAYVLSVTIGGSPFPQFFETDYVRAGLIRAGLAVVVVGSALWLRARPASGLRWALLGLLAVVVAVNGAWLVHGASRLEDRLQLMALTTLHSAAAAVWVGGLAQLVGLWWLVAREPARRPLWPLAVRRFAALGIAAALTVALSGVPLGLFYVESWGGLVGTAYGSLIAIKVLLLAVALGFATLNFRAGRRALAAGGDGGLRGGMPHLVEAETFLLLTLLLVAATLSSQPPAIDVTKERAHWAELVRVFEPKAPRLSSPPIGIMPKARPDPLTTVPGQRTLGDDWSEYNHNVSGLILMAISLAAFAARVWPQSWLRHWPLGFAGLAVFLFLRSDPEAWPAGPIGFVESLKDVEVLQHRLAIVLALALGLLDWYVRTSPRADRRLSYIFPILAATGGVLLLTHSHTAFEARSEYLIQVTHTVMGMLAVLAACGRWLELRLASSAGRWAGLGAVAAMFLIGVILTFYQETFV